MQTKWIKIVIVFLLLISLVMVRAFEHWFYDPLLSYFENDYLNSALPEISQWKLFFNISIRYLINSSLSILMIWFVFKNTDFVRFSLWFYIIAFIILISGFMVVLPQIETNYLPTFYIRRFLIQPLFLFLLLPAFHYQTKVAEKKKSN